MKITEDILRSIGFKKTFDKTNKEIEYVLMIENINISLKKVNKSSWYLYCAYYSYGVKTVKDILRFIAQDYYAQGKNHQKISTKQAFRALRELIED